MNWFYNRFVRSVSISFYNKIEEFFYYPTPPPPPMSPYLHNIHAMFELCKVMHQETTDRFAFFSFATYIRLYTLHIFTSSTLPCVLVCLRCAHIVCKCKYMYNLLYWSILWWVVINVSYVYKFVEHLASICYSMNNTINTITIWICMNINSSNAINSVSLDEKGEAYENLKCSNPAMAHTQKRIRTRDVHYLFVVPANYYKQWDTFGHLECSTWIFYRFC